MNFYTNIATIIMVIGMSSDCTMEACDHSCIPQLHATPSGGVCMQLFLQKPMDQPNDVSMFIREAREKWENKFCIYVSIMHLPLYILYSPLWQYRQKLNEKLNGIMKRIWKGNMACSHARKLFVKHEVHLHDFLDRTLCHYIEWPFQGKEGTGVQESYDNIIR